MTAEEWEAIDEPIELTTGLIGTTGLERKRRLVMCGCCRARFGTKVNKFEPWIEVAERSADNTDRELERSEMHHRLKQATAWPARDRQMLHFILLSDASNSNMRSALRVFLEQGKDLAPTACSLLRDIFGNPFRPLAFDPAWRTSNTLGLATAMYESRDFANMPILADALEEAGCDVPDVLEHCRNEAGVHVRGCWVVDQVLGKS
jgi:hypothetical protein